MKLFFVLAFVAGAHAAEPDWPALEAHAVEFFQQYVRIPSISPPSNTAPCASLFEAELKRNGLEPKLYASGPNGQTNLVVRLKGRDSSKKPILLLNHFDVVPVDPKGWNIDPFGAIIRDGLLWGRGAYDMKGIGTQQLMALIALHNSGIVPSRDIIMLSTADEEMGGVYGIQWMIKNHWDEIASEYVFDEGGMATRDYLVPGKLVFGVSVGDKVVLWMRLHARGTAGHGSQPIPDNANIILMHAIEKAMELPQSGKTNPVVEEMKKAFGQPMAVNKFTSAIERNTISLTTLTSGVGSPARVNVIPSSAEATLDCRLLPGTNSAEFISEMKARINDPRVTVEVINNAPDVGMSPVNTPLFATIREAVLKYHPDAIVTPMLVPFGTDSAYLQERGVIAYGFTPMIVDAATAVTMHSDSERISVDQFKTGLRIFYEILRQQ